jgi:hypothetical protein
MLSRQEEDRERRETLRNDLSVRQQQEESRRVFAQDQSLPNQATTFHQFAQADAETPRGRFTQVDAATVVGANPFPNYPAAAAHQRDPVPDEPALGYAIDDLNPSDPVEVFSSFTQQATDPTSADAPSTPSPGSMSEGTDVGSPSRRRTFRRY